MINSGGSMERETGAYGPSREWEETFYHTYMPIARSAAGYILYPAGTREDIEEVAQDTVCEAMMNYEKYDESRGKMAAYIRVMARSRALNFRKRQGRYQTVPLDGELELAAADEDMVELKDLVGRILEKLKPKEKILFTYRFLYHMTPEEIAGHLKCSRRAVDSRLMRLRRKLEGYFAENDIEVRGGSR